ncbi:MULTISPECIES: IS701 family transposase [Streptacidiphilus]|uniref:IS701 family transposase n=2 Tax=Streptacidiphilus TaxID=228398 RepID=A0ABV6UK00_9ACTN|nr:IS701 family transposase [Streptacidiphilus jeojiense]
MSTITYLRESRAAERQDEISAYCDELFTIFARSDQRRWGEVYLRGLLSTPGRKTPGAISEQVLGRRTPQPIQQFVNQSTWSARTLRQRLTEQMCAVAPPRAWALDEVVFPKNGNRSVGVARQFAPTQGRVMNCQLALATSLVHAEGSLPVNWRLLMPRSWDGDEELRDAAHVPAHEQSRPRWRYALDSLDEMLGGWDVPVAPVLADWRFEPDARQLLAGLEDRDLHYLVEVGPQTMLPVRPAALRAAPPAGASPVASVADGLGRHLDRAVLNWRHHHGARSSRSQFLVAQLGRCAAVHPRQPARPRHLVLEWPFGHARPRRYWVTDLSAQRLSETIALAELRHHSAHGCDRLHQDYGLGDFEGRSFPGWHHHVTLVSAARGFHALQQLQSDQGGNRWTGRKSTTTSSSAQEAPAASSPGA